MLRVDARRLACPLPIARLAQALRPLAPGVEVELVATDPAVQGDLPAFCAATGHELLSLEAIADGFLARVRRGRLPLERGSP